jgi:tRNA-intron lyase
MASAGPPEVITVTHVNGVFLIWKVEDCVRLRGKHRVACTPLGACEARLQSNGKLAAIPVALNDDELQLCLQQKWIRVIDGLSHKELSEEEVIRLTHTTDTNMLLRRLVFADLWAKGYRTTNGVKFGTDYLAYHGDPSTCHAAFMVSVVAESLVATPQELVGRARVATTAHKICVIAYADLAAGTVRYEAFKRMGPGTVSFQTASATLAALAAAAAATSAEASEASAVEAASSAMQMDLPAAPWVPESADESAAITVEVAPAVSSNPGSNADLMQEV